MWINHHGIFDGLKAANPALLWANFEILLGAVALPFPTAVLAEAFTGGMAEDEHTARRCCLNSGWRTWRHDLTENRLDHPARCPGVLRGHEFLTRISR